jgi:hypothetical protein
MRKKKQEDLKDEHMTAKADRPVEKYGDANHQIKKARVNGMQSQAGEIMVKTIITQINVLQENETIYKTMMGGTKYQQKIDQLLNKIPGMGSTQEPDQIDLTKDNNNDEKCR